MTEIIINERKGKDTQELLRGIKEKLLRQLSQDIKNKKERKIR